jgi:hypothetical protein
MIECKIHTSFSLVLKNEVLTVVRCTLDLDIVIGIVNIPA